MLWLKLQFIVFGILFTTFFVWWLSAKARNRHFETFDYAFASFIIALPISTAAYLALDLASACNIG